MDLPLRSTVSGISLAIFALAVAGVMAFGASQASASHVSCGDVITEDTTLDSDLDCLGTGEPALTVGADGVKLDLAGHRILTLNVGVLNEGHDNVKISEGTVTAGNGIPILLRDADRNRLRDLTAGGGGAEAVRLEASDRNRVERNMLGADGGGVVLVSGSDRNLITRNTLTDNGSGGGVAIFDSDGNVVSRNFIVFPSAGLSDDLLVGAGSDNTTVRRNDLQGPGSRDGIAVRAETTGTLLVRNRVRDYLGDGIQVDSPSTTLTRNSSNDNGGWGILAVPGVTDGGGNTASGNGAGQCLNVSC